jgi:hypothetical protein
MFSLVCGVSQALALVWALDMALSGFLVEQRSEVHVYMLLAAAVILLVLLGMVGGLLLFHVYLLGTNQVQHMHFGTIPVKVYPTGDQLSTPLPTRHDLVCVYVRGTDLIHLATRYQTSYTFTCWGQTWYGRVHGLVDGMPSWRFFTASKPLSEKRRPNRDVPRRAASYAST